MDIVLHLKQRFIPSILTLLFRGAKVACTELYYGSPSDNIFKHVVHHTWFGARGEREFNAFSPQWPNVLHNYHHNMHIVQYKLRGRSGSRDLREERTEKSFHAQVSSRWCAVFTGTQIYPKALAEGEPSLRKYLNCWLEIRCISELQGSFNLSLHSYCFEKWIKIRSRDCSIACDFK